MAHNTTPPTSSATVRGDQRISFLDPAWSLHTITPPQRSVKRPSTTQTTTRTKDITNRKTRWELPLPLSLSQRLVRRTSRNQDPRRIICCWWCDVYMLSSAFIPGGPGKRRLGWYMRDSPPALPCVFAWTSS